MKRIQTTDWRELAILWHLAWSLRDHDALAACAEATSDLLIAESSLPSPGPMVPDALAIVAACTDCRTARRGNDLEAVNESLRQERDRLTRLVEALEGQIADLREEGERPPVPAPRPGTERACPQCGKPFTVRIPSVKTRFCSRSCGATYRYLHDPPPLNGTRKRSAPVEPEAESDEESAPTPEQTPQERLRACTEELVRHLRHAGQLTAAYCAEVQARHGLMDCAFREAIDAAIAQAKRQRDPLLRLCQECGEEFHVAGANSKATLCPDCRQMVAEAAQEAERAAEGAAA